MRQGCGLRGNEYGSGHFGFHSRASLCASAICAGASAVFNARQHSAAGSVPSGCMKLKVWKLATLKSGALVEMMVEADMELVARDKRAPMGFDEGHIKLYPHFKE